MPKIIFVKTIENKVGNQTGDFDRFMAYLAEFKSDRQCFLSSAETICIMNRKDYNVKFFDILNFILLYIVPLLVMTVRIDFLRTLSSCDFIFDSLRKHHRADAGS